MEQLQPIDIDKVFMDKNPKLYRRLPKFLIRYLKRIVHQEELNEFIAYADGKYGADFAEAYLDFGDINVELAGVENLPKDGEERVIFAGNHPLGGLDGLALIDKLGHRYPNIKFMVNDILMQILNLRPLLLPINKHGSQAREAARAILEAHETDNPVFTFPAGLCSRKKNGEIRDLKWGKNVIANAINYQRDVIPVHVSGKNSNFFYGLSNWRNRLGIKANIEMLYLVDEVYKNHHSKMIITFGERIPYSTFTKEKTREEWAAVVKGKVYEMAQ